MIRLTSRGSVSKRGEIDYVIREENGDDLDDTNGGSVSKRGEMD